MKQPISTFTNIAFLIVGLVIILQAETVIQYVAGAVTTVLVVTSTGFHWTLSYWWQKADEVNMLALLPVLVGVQVASLVGVGFQMYLGVASLGFGVLLAVTHERWDNSTIGLMGSAAVLLMPLRVDWWQALVALVLFVSGIMVSRVLSDGEDPHTYHDLAHGTRHILFALGILAVTI